MPGQGDQHNDLVNGNPFEETKPHFSEYTATEIATLSSRLEKQLGPEYISSRPGAGGGKVHYLAAGMLFAECKTSIKLTPQQINASTLQMKSLGSTDGQVLFGKSKSILYDHRRLDHAIDLSQ